MSSHQNSAFTGESTLGWYRQLLSRNRYPVDTRTARPQLKPSARISPAPDEIWGHYNNYRTNGVVVSAVVHVALVGLLLSGAFFGREIVQKVVKHETVTLIAPSPESYALPTAKKVISGGGGGGDRDPLPAPKGRLPKAALQQITPPAIVMRNEKTKIGG